MANIEKPVSVRLDEKLLGRLDVLATELGRSRNWVIVRLLEDGFDVGWLEEDRGGGSTRSARTTAAKNKNRAALGDVEVLAVAERAGEKFKRGPKTPAKSVGLEKVAEASPSDLNRTPDFDGPATIAMPEPGTYGAVERKPVKIIEGGQTLLVNPTKCRKCEGPLVDWGSGKRCTKCGINY